MSGQTSVTADLAIRRCASPLAFPWADVTLEFTFISMPTSRAVTVSTVTHSMACNQRWHVKERETKRKKKRKRTHTASWVSELCGSLTLSRHPRENIVLYVSQSFWKQFKFKLCLLKPSKQMNVCLLESPSSKTQYPFPKLTHDVVNWSGPTGAANPLRMYKVPIFIRYN